MKEIKQFKLSSGEEIVCEVIEWPHDDDDGGTSDLVVRNVHKIVALEQSISGARMYTFRPWMVYQEGDEIFQTINWNHIIGEANPTEKVLEYYFVAVKGGGDADEEAKQDIQKRLEDYINTLRTAVEERTGYSDSDSDPKIIKFPTDRTYH